ncbi:MAG: CHAT domain-containing protein, partial [Caldilinea sp.]|nr:CHAT domain-containing protein [Caldilinea sp.]
IEEAIAAYRQALEVMTRAAMPVEWAQAMMNLATAYSDRIRGDRAQNIEEAIAAYRQALEVMTRAAMPVEWATSMMNLATAYKNRIRGDRAQNIEEAIAAYRQALEILTPDSLPDDCRRTARSLANLCFSEGRYAEVLEPHRLAMRAVDNLFRETLARSSQEVELAEIQGLPANAAYALARLDRLTEAVETMEAGRARLLAEALEQNRRDLEQLEPLGHGDLLAHYRAAAGRIAALRMSAAQPAAGPATERAPVQNFAALSDEIQAARRELDTAVDAIRQVPGYADFFLSPSFEKIQRAATPDAPLVYLLTTSAGSLALVVRAAAQKSDISPPPSVEAVWLDGFSNDDLNALLVRRDEGLVTGGYLPGQLGDHDALKASLAQALPQLGEALMGPLAAHLRTQADAGVVLVPAGRLSLLPLHAARYAVDGQDRCFLDQFSVRYTPSAGALATAHSESLRRHAPLSLAGVGNPLPDLDTGVWASQRAQTILDGLPISSANEHLDQARQLLRSLADASPQETIRAGELLLTTIQNLALGSAPVELIIAMIEIAQRIPPNLNYAGAELRSVLDLLAEDAAWTAFNHQATRDALWQALPNATWLHLSCHGQFNPQEPLDSALLLAAGTRITLRELLDRQQAAALQGIRLAFLSACQTAITDFNNVPDESVGLPAGFLQAGIPAVVGTLWPVNDASTALLVTRFYEFHLNGDSTAGLPPQPPASALRLAQQWLRDVTNKELAEYLDGHHRLKEASEQDVQRMSWTLIKETRREVRRAIRQGHGDARPFEAAYHWAPFVFYGAG